MHVVSASRRTDIAAFYTPWLLNRLEAEFCRVPNPFNGRPYEVSLRPDDVLAIVFWTKNPRPLLPHLERIEALGHRFYFQFTLNPYDHVFERSVLPVERAVDTLKQLAGRLGPDRVVWRYDPIVETSLTPWSWHLDRFGALADALAGHTRRCVFSFVDLHRRTRLRMDQLAVEHGFAYRFHNLRPEQGRWSKHGEAYTIEEMQTRARDLAALAAARGIALQTCCCDALIDPAHGIGRSRCVDPELVSLARGEPVRLKPGPTRDDCGCVESRDIGAYETCPHGCGASYCYAVQSHERAVANRRGHDPSAEALG